MACGHKSEKSHISPSLSEMTILSEVMKDDWEQSNVIFTSSCGPEEQNRLNQSEMAPVSNHNFDCKDVILGREGVSAELTQGESCGAVGLAVEWHSKRRNALVQIH